MKIFFSLLILLFASSFSFAQDYACTPLRDDETTIYGGNQIVVIIERKSLRQLRGTISDVNGESVGDNLVEVFTNPEYLLPESKNIERDSAQHKRIAGCRTGIDGKFSFANLPAGKYELRLSKGSGWNVTQVYVVVKPNKGKKRDLELTLSVGT